VKRKEGKQEGRQKKISPNLLLGSPLAEKTQNLTQPIVGTPFG